MQSIRAGLLGRFRQQMEDALGLERAIRLVWPAIVGSALAGSTGLRSLSGNTLIVSVPDRVWKGSLEGSGRRIIESVNDFWGKEVAGHIEFVLAPSVPSFPRPAAPSRPQPESSGGLSALELPAATIRDPRLREDFLRSAQKYFSHQQELEP